MLFAKQLAAKEPCKTNRSVQYALVQWTLIYDMHIMVRFPGEAVQLGGQRLSSDLSEVFHRMILISDGNGRDRNNAVEYPG